MGDRTGQPPGRCELLHLQHAPLHLELFKLFPGREVAQHGYSEGDLTPGVINLA